MEKINAGKAIGQDINRSDVPLPLDATRISVRRWLFENQLAEVNRKFGFEPRRARRGIASTLAKKLWLKLRSGKLGIEVRLLPVGPRMKPSKAIQ